MKKILYAVLMIIFSILTLVLLSLILEERMYSDIIILILLLALTIIISILFVLELKGKKEYIINSNEITVKRKNKILEIIQKEEIIKALKLVDAITNEIVSIVLMQKDKKTKILISRNNKESIEKFINHLPCKTKRDYFYYLIMLFIN